MIEQLGKNKWKFVVNIGSGATRRRPSKVIEGNYGKKELKKLYEQFEAEVSDKPLSDITIEEMIETYIDHRKALGRKATTIKGYKACLERLEPRFKRISAKDCTTYQIDKEIAVIANNGRSAKTVRNTVGVISAAFDHAIKSGQLKENPCKAATLPTGKQREVRILRIDEIQPFARVLAEQSLDDRVGFELALFMGLRRSEILGLKESDVDLQNKALFIHNTRHRVSGEDIDQDTKTARSTRVLALPDILVMDIAALMQLHRNLKYGCVDYLVQDGFGNIINPSTFAARLRRMEEKNNLPPVTLHGLRHTYASMLNYGGVDMARISRELGHKNLSVTQDVYTHIFATANQSSRGIANTINSFLEEPMKVDEKEKHE